MMTITVFKKMEDIAAFYDEDINVIIRDWNKVFRETMNAGVPLRHRLDVAIREVQWNAEDRNFAQCGIDKTFAFPTEIRPMSSEAL